MEITFHGAARTTTGSMHLVDFDGTRILLDCGLYQGKRKEAFEKNRHFPFDPSSVHKVLLSHAHMDHSGNLPSLVKKGFRGRIFATPATVDLCDIMLRDSAHLQEKDVFYVNKKREKQGKTLFEPLYTQENIDPTMELFDRVPYGQEFEVCTGVTATFNDAGHILGSSTITLDIRENHTKKRLLFTGDLGRNNMPILKNPVIVKNVDYLITESTYGNRFHPPKTDIMLQLESLVNEIYNKKSKLIIPSFSVGRTQQMVFFLNNLHGEKRIPPIPVYVDSPLSSKATTIYKQHPECYDQEAVNVVLNGHEPFHFNGLKYITDVEDSKTLNEKPGPVIIISSSGMCEGGRILHHLKNNIENPENIILFIGYQAQNTLGRRIVKKETPIRIFGEEYTPKATIKSIQALSAHADKDELLGYIKEIKSDIKKAFVVHGEPEQSDAFAESLRETGLKDVIVPEPGLKISL